MGIQGAEFFVVFHYSPFTIHTTLLPMPGFVIQEHQRQRQDTHWDLMLEQGDVLKTFRLNLHPSHLQEEPAQAIPIADHDKRFLSYEGPVNRGQGSVRIVEQGTYKTRLQDESQWELVLAGHVLAGKFVLSRIGAKKWTLTQYSCYQPKNSTN